MAPHWALWRALKRRAAPGISAWCSFVDEWRRSPARPSWKSGAGLSVLIRWLAQRTGAANRLLGVDVAPSMLRKARGMTRHEQIEDVITFQDGHAEALPFPARSFDHTMSCTMLDEVDADRSIAGSVRVTKPVGRVGIIVRSLEMPDGSTPLDQPLKTTVEAPSRLRGGVQAQGCADANLYRRRKDVGLVQVRMFPQWAISTEGTYFGTQRGKLLINLSPEDTQRCREALSQAEAAGYLLDGRALPLCGVGAPNLKRERQEKARSKGQARQYSVAAQPHSTLQSMADSRRCALRLSAAAEGWREPWLYGAAGQRSLKMTGMLAGNVALATGGSTGNLVKASLNRLCPRRSQGYRLGCERCRWCRDGPLHPDVVARLFLSKRSRLTFAGYR